MCYFAALYAPAGLKNYFSNKNDSTPVMHEKITLKRTWWVPCLLFFGHPFELYYYQTIIKTQVR